MAQVITIGEIMATEVGQTFLEPVSSPAPIRAARPPP
jgi:hypothetical protein